MPAHAINWFEIPVDDFDRAIKVDDFLPAREGSLVYLNGGDDLSPILARVEEAGGKVLTEKTLITEEIGCYATFLDTEGNKVALHSPH